ncbi:PREDICTED: uncharacterized protein LOC104604754 isoform X2 [Nelumbo nucifera]|uniref:Uncharacterized protein n=2 Tax=Nelumbo nucifera TaxID=4432 RepID=A0A822XFZ9_NELNU|nr:PREDICTED: uncharacterized protein LOC104604754 isoform X2 [Nelumbo nucifera]DAD17946.1 TPA_asm: hypothetical protein HUJ06_019409 [Nelumbo nucifera]
MAAAEARAAWQRTANRCFVQEDAKRAPKLACCPSASSSKPQVDVGAGDLPHGPDHPITGFMPLNWNPSNSNLPPDTKWWLQLQPNFGYQKDFTYEQLNDSEAELEVLRAEEINQASILGADNLFIKEDSIHAESNKNAESFSEPQWQAGVPATCMKHEAETRVCELKAVNSKKQPLKHKDIGDYWYQDEELVDLDPSLISKQSEKVFSYSQTPWIGAEKTEPWWRIMDKDDLASLVAKKSLEHIENCDLPRPQTMHVSRGQFACHECFNHDTIFSSSLDKKSHSNLSNLTDYLWGSPTSQNMDEKELASDEVGNSLYRLDEPFRNSVPVVTSSSSSSQRTSKDPAESKHTLEGDPSKAQLLEALRHSQTRAREAEKAAQKAYSEKEHIIKLFFKQASQLFAYKQWFQLLQLEALCVQLKNKDQPISTLFPMILPWMPCKARQLRKGQHKAAKRNRGSSKHDICRYAFAFAVGLSLAGAGLFLGWTMGWLLPTF